MWTAMIFLWTATIIAVLKKNCDHSLVTVLTKCPSSESVLKENHESQSSY